MLGARASRPLMAWASLPKHASRARPCFGSRAGCPCYLSWLGHPCPSTLPVPAPVLAHGQDACANFRGLGIPAQDSEQRCRRDACVPSRHTLPYLMACVLRSKGRTPVPRLFKPNLLRVVVGIASGGREPPNPIASRVRIWVHPTARGTLCHLERAQVSIHKHAVRHPVVSKVGGGV